MKETTRRELLGAVSAYADEVASALESEPRLRQSRLWRDLAACELLLRALLLSPALLQLIDAEPPREGGRQTVLAENLDPQQEFPSLARVAEQS